MQVTRDFALLHVCPWRLDRRTFLLECGPGPPGEGWLRWSWKMTGSNLSRQQQTFFIKLREKEQGIIDRVVFIDKLSIHGQLGP